MKEYSPKPDLWSKIQQRRDFDMQVKAHIPNLPERMPKADLWNAIERQMDQEKPVVPLWKYGMAAACIALLLTFAGIAYLQVGKKDMAKQLFTEVNQSPEKRNIKLSDEKQTSQSESAVEAFEESESGNLQTIPVQKQKITRNTIKPIKVREIELEDLSKKNITISEIIIPPIPEYEKAETFHKVRVSWGIQERSKIITTFGASDPEEITYQHTGRVPPSKNSIKINFQKQ
ncbi:hypothetical protein [Algoriphagus sp.]|uniref:hypothetical protein n=1 Tax=Algoriphagus sp. TaxID=1872435 RepID=UPI003F6F6E13